MKYCFQETAKRIAALQQELGTFHGVVSGSPAGTLSTFKWSHDFNNTVHYIYIYKLFI